MDADKVVVKEVPGYLSFRIIPPAIDGAEVSIEFISLYQRTGRIKAINSAIDAFESIPKYEAVVHYGRG